MADLLDVGACPIARPGRGCVLRVRHDPGRARPSPAAHISESSTAPLVTIFIPLSTPCLTGSQATSPYPRPGWSSIGGRPSRASGAAAPGRRSGGAASTALVAYRARIAAERGFRYV